MLSDWFWEWFEFHKLMAPHQAWAYPQYSPKSPIGAQMFGAWMEKFSRLEVTEAEAREASLLLMGAQPGFPEHHLAAIVAEVRAMREEAHRRGQAARLRAFRAEADSLHARREEARGRWAEMPEEERAGVRERVGRENPALRRFPRLIEAICLDQMAEEEERIEAEAAARTGPKARTKARA